MRGVTGFRALDAINGALAQLFPTASPAAGEGGNTLAVFGAERPDGRAVHLLRAVVGTWGGTPRDDGNDGLTNPASLAANIPVEVAESEFPIGSSATASCRTRAATGSTAAGSRSSASGGA